MGSYTFKWEHAAEEAFVTGTFDDWQKTVKLEKEGDVFQKTVDLPESSEKVYYKFVVDNTWTINESAAHEADKDGNVNNFLTGADLTPSLGSAFINTVTPESSTVAMAGKKNNKKQAPKQAADADTAPAPAEAAPVEAREDTATPSNVPGGFPVTPANEEEDKVFGVSPLPAAPGAVNPVHLLPGEKIPESIAAQDISEHVKLDKASYEKSDALPGAETELPPVSKNLIPESSLPMGNGEDVTINTVGAGATTTALAGQVPLEPKAPEVVKESQDQTGAAREASAVASEVQDKAKVEEAPGKDTLAEKAGPAVNDVTTAATDAAKKNLPHAVKQQLPESAQNGLTAGQTKEDPREKVSPEVPSEVKQSFAEAGESPEAAANTAAVVEKKEVESELLKEVKPAPAVDDVEPTEAKTTEAAETKAPEAEPEAATTEAVKAGAAEPETVPAAAAAANVNVNGAESKPAESNNKPAQPSAVEKKKKSRLSTFFGRIREKLSDKK
ncbi:Uncharacterized protein TPAR_02342 [Tolypocladium paradoxum]|uniref:AMP-activated protein kinase glycogen-binding domain-containing protein n=1 Tax=Tolypocladium paradoxum TaxID=94208 RepID=A0A2S4L4S9_9HYPO|nr:Uncharacterized protein TPAR_02342 [Tolypocladium paradoxum]